MSNTIFNVFGENDCPSVRQKNILTSKNAQLGPAPQFSGLLKGKNVGLGAPASSQKRALGDVGNKIGNQQPPSANKLKGKQPIIRKDAPLGNVTNTPKNKPLRSSTKSDGAQMSSLRQLWNKPDTIVPLNFTPRNKAQNGMSEQKQTPLAIKMPDLGTPISINTVEIKNLDCDEPEIFPSYDGPEHSFFDLTLPDEMRITNEDLDRMIDVIRSNFHLSGYYEPPPSPVPRFIDDSEFYSVNDVVEEPLPMEDILVPELPNIDWLL